MLLVYTVSDGMEHKDRTWRCFTTRARQMAFRDIFSVSNYVNGSASTTQRRRLISSRNHIAHLPIWEGTPSVNHNFTKTSTRSWQGVVKHPLDFFVKGRQRTEGTDVLPQDLVKPQSHEIGCYDDRITLKMLPRCLSNFRAIGNV